MKKLLSIIIFSLLITGCGTKPEPRNNTDAGQGQAPEQAQEKKNIFTSIKDAISKSISLRCEYTDEDGEVTIAHIKGNAIKMESKPKTDQDMVFQGIIRDDKMWVWTKGGEKKGMVIDFKNHKGSPVKMSDTEVTSTEDVIKEIESKKDTCKNAVIADSEFELPKDYQFVAF